MPITVRIAGAGPPMAVDVATWAGVDDTVAAVADRVTAGQRRNVVEQVWLDDGTACSVAWGHTAVVVVGEVEPPEGDAGGTV